jgi:hypothetical protein|tara:strand:- start:1775 stop:2113 length:339 start_codon:yes stop_codon:yes gene_type:complete
MTGTGKKNKQYPDRWIGGPNPERRKRRRDFYRAKAQARFRGEAFLLTEADWLELWTAELYAQRGRQKHSLILTRKDIDGAWERANVVVIPRKGNMSRHIRHNKDRQKIKNVV